MKTCLVGIAAVVAGAVVCGTGGCASVQPTPVLPADAFVANRPVTGPGSGEPIDHPGLLVYGQPHPTIAAPPEAAPHISPTVREGVRSQPDDAFSRQNNGAGVTIAPAATDASVTEASVSGPSVRGPSDNAVGPQGSKPGASTGQWQSVGAVLAVVNSEPIFADKVIHAIDRALAAEARSGSEEHFRRVADDLVNNQIREVIENEMEYAAAQRSLEKPDEQLAAQVTAEWRKDQVRRAGGSEALAHQKAIEDGFDFEELVKQQYRLNLTRLYYQKKIFPLIQVTAEDLRDYYQAHLDQFQKPAAAKFRVIFIGSDKNGGRELALEKARKVYEMAKAGADFADLAAKHHSVEEGGQVGDYNDDPGLLKTRGAVGDAKGWMEKGGYESEKVEQAVWEMKPGEVSPPIDAPHHGVDGFFIAKVEEIQPGVVQPFDNENVQAAIHDKLHREQFARLREIHRKALLQNAVIYENPDMLRTAMEMVMQRYGGWVATR